MPPPPAKSKACVQNSWPALARRNRGPRAVQNRAKMPSQSVHVNGFQTQIVRPTELNHPAWERAGGPAIAEWVGRQSTRKTAPEGELFEGVPNAQPRTISANDLSVSSRN